MENEEISNIYCHFVQSHFYHCDIYCLHDGELYFRFYASSLGILDFYCDLFYP